MEELRWKKFPVLSDGFVALVDWMGTDASIAQAARVSYGAGTKTINDDRNLIRYLLRHEHTSPIEMCDLKLLVRVPMDVWRQWIRHRTASVNEYSTRYSIAIDSYNTTSSDQWRRQSQNKKQGSDGFVEDWPEGRNYFSSDGTTPTPGEYLTLQEQKLCDYAQSVYQERLAFGVSREQARKDLPLSTYTEAYWKMDLHNLLHFLKLRMAPAAQQEIRMYADVIGYEIVAKLFPATWEAFLDFVKDPVSINRLEEELLRRLKGLLPVKKEFLLPNGIFFSYLPEIWQKERSSEREECLNKFERLGLVC